jgi:hypothetical protein
MVFMALLIVSPVLSITVHANAGGGTEHEVDLSEILVPVVTTRQSPEPRQLTPPGNMDIVDDISGDFSGDKQFITVVTKNNNYFYIVIDRARSSENVYFLNLVDESDLLAILDNGKPIAAEPVAPTPVPIQAPAPEPTPAPAHEPKQGQGNLGGLIITLILILAIGGGAYYYFKVMKPKQAIKGGTAVNLDEFVFDEDEETISNDGNGDDGGNELHGEEDELPEDDGEND